METKRPRLQDRTRKEKMGVTRDANKQDIFHTIRSTKGKEIARNCRTKRKRNMAQRKQSRRNICTNIAEQGNTAVRKRSAKRHTKTSTLAVLLYAARKERKKYQMENTICMRYARNFETAIHVCYGKQRCGRCGVVYIVHVQKCKQCVEGSQGKDTISHGWRKDRMVGNAKKYEITYAELEKARKYGDSILQKGIDIAWKCTTSLVDVEPGNYIAKRYTKTTFRGKERWILFSTKIQRKLGGNRIRTDICTWILPRPGDGKFGHRTKNRTVAVQSWNNTHNTNQKKR